MHRFIAGTEDHKCLIMIIRPDDLRLYRQAPCVDMSAIDGVDFGRPDIIGVVTYAANRNQARALIRRAGKTISENIPESDYCFSGEKAGRKLMGFIMSEATANRLETAPMKEFVSISGEPFGITGFSLMILYANADRPVVGFLRSMGFGIEKIANEPALAAVWQNYGTEVVEDYRAMAQAAGMRFPDDDGEPVNIKLGTFENGMSEAKLMAVRGEELAWFAANPNETEYYRRTVPGEFPEPFKAEWVRVVKGDPEANHRFRTPMNRLPDGTFVEQAISSED